MTGDTENGRSIRVTSTLLPGKRNLAIAHAAATPKTRLSGTVIAAVSNVRRIAASASGSVIAVTYAPTPLRKPSSRTNSSGTNRNTVRKASAAPISSRRTQAASSRCGARTRGTSSGSAIAVTGLSSALRASGLIRARGGPSRSCLRALAAARPRLQPVDRQQQRERDDQHHDGDRGRARIVVLLELGDDDERRDLGHHRHVGRD